MEISLLQGLIMVTLIVSWSLLCRRVALGSTAEPSLCLGFWSLTTPILCWAQPKGKGAGKAIGGVRGKAPLLDLVALTPRPLAVAKLKVDAKRKAAPKEVAAKPEDKAKFGAKAKAVGDVGVAPVLPVACGLIGGGPVLPPPLDPADLLPHQFLLPRVVRAAPIPVAVPPIANGVPPGFTLPAFHGGLHPAGFPPVIREEFAPPAEVCVGPPPVAHVSVTAVDQLGDVSRWFHGPAGFEELHGMFVNPDECLEFLVYDRAGAPSATSIVRLTRRWPSNATGWFAEVNFVGCSDPLFGQLFAHLLPLCVAHWFPGQNVMCFTVTL